MSVEARYFRDEMDHVQSDDKMEMATSPYRVVNETEFDEDISRDPFPDNQMVDAVDHTIEDVDLMQADLELPYHDDDMLDDDNFAPQAEEPVALEFEMEAYDQVDGHEAEDDILLDDEVTAVELQNETSAPAMTEEISTTETYAEGVDAASAADEEQEEEIYEEQLFNNTNEPTTDSTFVFGDSTNTESQQNLDQDPQEDLDRTKESSDAVATNDMPGPLSVHNDQELGTSSSLQETISPEEVAKVDQEPLSDGHHPSAPFQEATEQSHGVNVAEKQANIPTTSHESADTELAKSDVVTTAIPDSYAVTHPVNVVYLGQEMSLFPPSEGDSSSTFFLADRTLAQKPFDQLLKVCRDILGESLEHDDELVLDVPLLGLHVCEDSRYASQISLSEVIDVYTVLSRNERTTAPPPLQCLLSSRVCLASQYAYLSSAACEGKTFSEVAADYVDSPDADAEYDGDLAEDQLDPVDHFSAAAELETDQEHDTVTTDEADEGLNKPTSHGSGHESPDVHPQNSHDEVQAEVIEENSDQIALENIDDQGEEHRVSLVEQTAAVDADSNLSKTQKNNETSYPSGDGNEPASAEPHDEVETPSSHTVEADDHIPSQDHTQTAEVHDPSADAVGTSDAQNEDDISYSDDESLREEGDDLDTGVGNDTAEDIDEQEEDLFATKSDIIDEIKHEARGASTPFSHTANGHAVADSAHTVDETESMPTTPSKQSNGKRKTFEDDDDLDSFDFDTPDAKRLRP